MPPETNFRVFRETGRPDRGKRKKFNRPGHMESSDADGVSGNHPVGEHDRESLHAAGNELSGIQ